MCEQLGRKEEQILPVFFFILCREKKSCRKEKTPRPGNISLIYSISKQRGHDGPVSLHWLIRKISSYQTLQYLESGLKRKTPKTGLKLVAIVVMFNNKISKDFTIYPEETRDSWL